MRRGGRGGAAGRVCQREAGFADYEKQGRGAEAGGNAGNGPEKCAVFAGEPVGRVGRGQAAGHKKQGFGNGNQCFSRQGQAFGVG